MALFGDDAALICKGDYMRYVHQLRCGGCEGLEHRQGEDGWRLYRDSLKTGYAESERTSGARPAPVSVGERISCNP
ncbi:hypothetical protein Y032_0831g2582 [Ancylostoma ceylanicum]|uniref:Uncharacterized protein n=1 Tax=Ancylostoma ceylanicum TaxID=53326 RepID=A0A016WBT0_9BILA|nr:hypothetical protein Y032_0831g2582 [Ancylostoma ceylanicum]